MSRFNANSRKILRKVERSGSRKIRPSGAPEWVSVSGRRSPLPRARAPISRGTSTRATRAVRTATDRSPYRAESPRLCHVAAAALRISAASPASRLSVRLSSPLTRSDRIKGSASARSDVHRNSRERSRAVSRLHRCVGASVGAARRADGGAPPRVHRLAHPHRPRRARRVSGLSGVQGRAGPPRGVLLRLDDAADSQCLFPVAHRPLRSRARAVGAGAHRARHGHRCQYRRNRIVCRDLAGRGAARGGAVGIAPRGRRVGAAGARRHRLLLVVRRGGRAAAARSSSATTELITGRSRHRLGDALRHCACAARRLAGAHRLALLSAARRAITCWRAT